MTPADAYNLILLSLCCWREARGESLPTKLAQCWSVRNRVASPRWWGMDYPSVILKPFQYSSFNVSDPNATKFPQATDASWDECLSAAQDVYLGTVPDPTLGATSYHDTTIPPPAWTASMTRTVQVGGLVFYRA